MLARLRNRIATARGVTRSLRTYYRPSHLAAMTAFYRTIVKPGDLVFDIGAHVGDRVLAFRRLGCRVVALEPQPALAFTLRRLYGRNPGVSIVQAAVSDEPGSLRLRINTRNPTVSTASSAFVDAAQAGAVGWGGQVWDEDIHIDAVTLDGLIARYGLPSFVKIDVEGLEDRVLAGLSHPVPALSFEFTTHQRDVALNALRLARAKGFAVFNACLGESWQKAFADACGFDAMASWLASLPDEANSGDIYCYRND
jgi:FkbM family methyltransferase